jgi:hypothetical protein
MLAVGMAREGSVMFRLRVHHGACITGGVALLLILADLAVIDF